MVTALVYEDVGGLGFSGLAFVKIKCYLCWFIVYFMTLLNEWNLLIDGRKLW